MSYPQQERGEQDKVFMDVAEAQQTETPPAEPPQLRPVVDYPFKTRRQGKEITARLEQGIQLLTATATKSFNAMSKFHDYSLNNTSNRHAGRQFGKGLFTMAERV